MGELRNTFKLKCKERRLRIVFKAETYSYQQKNIKQNRKSRSGDTHKVFVIIKQERYWFLR